MSTMQAIGEIGSRTRSRLGPVLAFAMAFRLLQWIILAPLTAATLRLFLDRWGRASVGNFEIASFLLSPVGIAALLAVGSLTIAATYLELAGLLRLLADRRLAWWQALVGLGPRFPRLVELGLRQLVVFLALAVPFLAAIGGVYAALWSGRDIYGLLRLKPPVYWIGVGLAGLLGAAYATLAGRLFLRWFYALPAVLFEPGTTAPEALRSSVTRSRGRLLVLLGWLLAWAAVILAINACLLGAVRAGSDYVLDRTGSQLGVTVAVTALVLAIDVAIVTTLSVLGTTTFAGLILARYRRDANPFEYDPTGDEPAPPLWLRTGRRWRLGAVTGLAALAGFAGYRLLVEAPVGDRLEITAHRGASAVAPENTVPAILAAFEAGADWAELDVQTTADGELAVLHDSDLVRIGGPNRQVQRSTLAEIRAIDLGRVFGAQWAGTRVPTLDEVLAAASDRIRLNIELKPHNTRDVEGLVTKTIAAVKARGMGSRCRICSQSYPALQRARTLLPGVSVGFIAGAAIGDLSRLNVEFLMVNIPMATRGLVESAARHGMEVHAWSLKDPAQLAPLLDRGVANVIGDDPALIRRRLDEIRGLDPVERLLLRARNLLSD